MRSIALESLQALLGLLGLAVGVLPAGYLLHRWLRPRGSSMPYERLLWAVSLGLPATVALSVWGQRYLPRAAVDGVFGILAIAACTLAASAAAQSASAPSRLSLQPLRWLGAVAVLFALYCFAETLDIQVGHHLYLSTLINDWGVRIAMVEGAMRSGVPPINGLSTLSPDALGVAPHLRYYYFWYVLVAQVATLLHISAQPALAASCIWAGWGFMAALFLTLKYVLGEDQRWARACLWLCLLLTVLGLDILPTATMWLSHTHHPLMEMEWWRPDRTPSFLGMVLASPHHIAGFCSLLTGTLLLFLLGSPKDEGLSPGFSRRLTMIFLAGLFFATASGLSLFPTVCFAVGLSFWALDLLRRREWARVGALAASGLLALLLAHSYLQELSSGSSAASGFLGFAWRSRSFAAVELARFAHPASHSAPTNFILQQLFVAVLDFMELGIYLLVLAVAVHGDLIRPGRLSRGRCLWWALLLGAGIPAYFLSSTATSGPNDLGFDAGFLFRLCLQLWAAGWVAASWRRRQEASATPGRQSPTRQSPMQRLVFGAAVCLAALGIAAQVYQVLSIRLYFPLLGSGLVHKQVDVLLQDQLPTRLFNIRSALGEFDRRVPPSRPDTEAVQFNPIGPLLAAQIYFNTHQVASWDAGCGTSFGGDYSHCAPVYASLLFLYGNTQAGVLRSRALNSFQDGAAARVASAEDLASVCRHLKLRAVIADASDSIWTHPGSWVWTGPVLVANSTVRVIGCPAGSWRP